MGKQKFNYNEVIGKTYEKLTVTSLGIRLDKKGHQRTTVICLCSCGKQIEFLFYDWEKQKSCGCARIEKSRETIKIATATWQLPSELSSQNQIYNRTKNYCKRISRDFTLTREEFDSITKQQCHYCGEFPELKKTYAGLFPSQGLDRKDSTKGYSLENVVPCCKMCNIAKKDHPYEQFIAWIHKTSAWLSKGVE